VLAAIESRRFLGVDDSRRFENRTFSNPICYLRRLILSTHTMQAPVGAEDECLDG
jgi:hypothetical protein